MSGMTDSGAQSEPTDNTGRALKLQTDTPHLVNIGGDRLSTSVTLHPIPQGRVTLGCGSGVDIPVQGTGVLPLHCHIENSEGVVTIYPLSENLSIDGVKISRPTRLYQGVMLTIGRSNYMRFNHPAEAKIMKSVLPNPRISMVPITFEPNDTYFETKFTKKPPTVPKKSPRESFSGDDDDDEDSAPSSVITKVTKFEYLAQQNFKKSISPKVFTSNLVTVNTPAKDVLGKCPPNIQNFTKNLPQNALNYSELNHNEKHQVKSPDRILGSKKSPQQPQYVNVAINEAKNINNRVIIYEKECILKNHHTVNLDYNDLNNKSSPTNKNINVNKVMTPSPNYNRNPSPSFRSMTPSPASNCVRIDHRRSGSMGEIPRCRGSLENLEQRKTDAELKRTKAQQDRIKEQEIEKAEKARLEEILNLCVEYEKQAQVEKSKTMPNRIKTNGSLPRDKRQYGNLIPSYGTPPPSPRDAEMFHNNNEKRHHSYENVSVNHHNAALREASYENIELKADIENRKKTACGSPYENVYFQQPGSPIIPSHSPRTRIKTFILSPNKDNFSNNCNSPKETAEMVESKFAVLEAELGKLKEKPSESPVGSTPKKEGPAKFIFPLDETDVLPATPDRRVIVNGDKSKSDSLKLEKKETVQIISTLKRRIAEYDIQEEELQRELDIEHALIAGEHKSKMLDLGKLEARKEKLVKYAQKIEENMHHHQVKQEEDQKECKHKLDLAQKQMQKMDETLAATAKDSDEYEQVFEEYLKAQEVLDNERKTFEDLEFHHLEEEADWLASREEVQREIVELSKRIESIMVHLQDLEQQKCKTSNNTEFRLINKKRTECLRQLEKFNESLKSVDYELSSIFSNQESEEMSTDSDSDKSKDIDRKLSRVADMSCSIIVSNFKAPLDHMSNMSQSFNEKLLEEKSVLESGQRYPSQDDIDRISKVTSNAPIDIGEEQGSLGRKAIESLKDIQRRRQLHLAQQGSQVIEQERQRVLALKERVQQEVRTKWAQQRLDEDPVPACVPGDVKICSEPIELRPETTPVASPEKSESLIGSDGAESPRPMSEISEMSVETGTATKKRRAKPLSDKQRPLTRYLPIRGTDLDLRQHIESAGHQVVLCPHVIINSSTCRGFLQKKGSKFNGWSKRWFVFDRNKHTFTYYIDKSEKRPRGGAYFQAIEEVYLDHLNSIKSSNPQLTFIVKTHERFYYLMAPSPEAMRIWVDVIFTGAEGYQEFGHGS